jgi:hypothetical protein
MHKVSGEIDNSEKEAKRLHKDLNERELHFEAVDR